MITISASTYELECINLALSSANEIIKNYGKRNHMDVTPTLVQLKTLASAVNHQLHAPLPIGDDYKESLDELERLQEQINQ